MPLVRILPILQPLLLTFAVVFSKPQRRHFDNYLQGLICQEARRTLAGMGRYVVEGPDASSWDRFVTVAPWELPALNDRFETGEVQPVARLAVAALHAQFVPAAMLTEAGVPYPQAAVTPQWRTFTKGQRTFRALAYRGRLEGIGRVQLVVVQERYRDGSWSPYVPLVTNRLDLTAPEVVEVYLERWSVEVLIRDLKQNLGLGDCQMERLEGTVRHWVLAFVSQALLMLLRLQADAGELRTASGQPVASVGRTLGEVRQFVRECALVELLTWTCEQAAAGHSAAQIAQRLGLPA